MRNVLLFIHLQKINVESSYKRYSLALREIGRIGWSDEGRSSFGSWSENAEKYSVRTLI